MEHVGVRELKNNLSRHLRRVRKGARLVVTDRGRSIATIAPIETERASSDREWLLELVRQGRVHWNGGKPRGSANPAKIRGKSISETVLEDRE